MANGKGSIGAAVLWMAGLSLLLFWLPLLGPFLAGLVGGRRAGGVGPAIVAVFLPAIVFGAALFLLTSVLSGMPLVGVVAGMGGLVMSLAHVGPLLLGAIVGGLLA
ncbi:MAG TPA: hypothetical protein VEQ10_05435 [Vicinamibacteria bacterium]|nr:hypothetical protein [Vicinamibacteria bacterium]